MANAPRRRARFPVPATHELDAERAYEREKHLTDQKVQEATAYRPRPSAGKIRVVKKVLASNSSTPCGG